MRDQGLGSWPARRARMAPEATAVVHDGGSLSYGELAARVTRLAHALRALGVGHGDRVAYLGANHPALAETLFAANTLGAVFVPLNTRLAAPELAFILGDAGAPVLLYDAELTDVVDALRDDAEVKHYVEVGSAYEELLANAPDDPLDETVGLDEVCMIQYTSGTSGRPKGVMLTHANIAWNCFNMLLDGDIASDDVALVVAPMFHTAALNTVFLPGFLKGGTSVLMHGFDPDRVLDVIAEHRVTRMFGVPAMYQAREPEHSTPHCHHTVRRQWRGPRLPAGPTRKPVDGAGATSPASPTAAPARSAAPGPTTTAPGTLGRQPGCRRSPKGCRSLRRKSPLEVGHS
ncbi:AMP-binding protein [Streptomyces sp. NPDC046942]|uniref:AMP-binding protein n=1 Tax=Streptomyces sp. NPDC046942 TaxID=3155137 RepID=UPI0033D1D847